MYFLLCHRQVLHSTGNDDELTGADRKITIAQLDYQGSFDHQKKLILVLMLVPYEFTLHPGKLHMVVIELANDLRAPITPRSAQI